MKKLFFTSFLSLLIALSANAQDQKSTKIKNTSKDPATVTVVPPPATKAAGRSVATTNPASTFADAVSKMETNHSQAKTQAKSTEVPAQPVKKTTVTVKTKKS